jgi:molybdopterin converting factor small subunit
MQVTVRLSGELARIAGAARLALDLPDGARVADACALLAERLPELGGALGSTLPVVRGTHVEPAHELEVGDELALLLPAAGGAEPDPTEGS